MRCEKIIDIAAGANHTLIVTNAGFVYSTGCNLDGQLGQGNKVSLHEFKKVIGLSNIMTVAAGSHSGAIDCDGQLYIWGTGVFGTFLSPLKISNYQESGMFESISIN